jgi:hypothetical protein
LTLRDATDRSRPVFRAVGGRRGTDVATVG